MSAMPPNLAGPVLQSALVQRQVSAVRDSEQAQSAHARRQTAVAVDLTDTTVETTDNDTKVHTDSEGQGGQGRAFQEAEEQPPDAEQQSTPSAGEHGSLIDLEA